VTCSLPRAVSMGAADWAALARANFDMDDKGASVARIQGEILINRPVEVVFDFVSDECNEPLYNPEVLSVEKLSPGPVRSGTKYRAQMKSRGRTVPLDLEFTAFERPVRLGSHAVFSGVATDGELTFDSLGESTRMLWVWDITPAGAMRILTPLVIWMGRRQEARIWGELKRYLESAGSELP
jgi:hypothetical protein